MLYGVALSSARTQVAVEIVPRKPLLVESPDPHSPTTQVAVKVMPKKPLLVAGGDRSPLSLRTQVAVEIVPQNHY